MHLTTCRKKRPNNYFPLLSYQENLIGIKTLVVLKNNNSAQVWDKHFFKRLEDVSSLKCLKNKSCRFSLNGYNLGGFPLSRE